MGGSGFEGNIRWSLSYSHMGHRYSRFGSFSCWLYTSGVRESSHMVWNQPEHFEMTTAMADAKTSSPRACFYFIY